MELIKASLLDRQLSMAERYRSVFTLRNIGGTASVNILAEAFKDPSALLRHEVAYVLGQLQDPHAIPHLEKLLKNTDEDSMVRHEAGEALGAIGLPDVVPLLEQYSQDPIPEVAETCRLAIDTIKWKLKNPGKSIVPEGSAFASIDPAPPSSKTNVEYLKKRLLDPSLSMFKRYKAMFALRELGTKEAVLALTEGFNDSSALFRHELAYVLGQVQHQAAVPKLSQVLSNTGEHGMVRHEAAEALGAIASEETQPLLQHFLKDEKAVVRESCIVALDICDYVQSDDFEYANALQLAKQQLTTTASDEKKED